ncbi:MAG: hypothetical protein LBO72_00445 [Helicobacteraceae bacterium]|nr:hypothetical protein [Helicobacteraceae bacterium]
MRWTIYAYCWSIALFFIIHDFIIKTDSAWFGIYWFCLWVMTIFITPAMIILFICDIFIAVFKKPTYIFYVFPDCVFPVTVMGCFMNQFPMRYGIL